MTLSKGNGEGETGGQSAKNVEKNVENVATKIAARIAFIIVVPALGWIVADVLRDFEDKLKEIQDAQTDQATFINQKLDEQARDMQTMKKDRKEGEHEIQLQLKVIEEFLRNNSLLYVNPEDEARAG